MIVQISSDAELDILDGFRFYAGGPDSLAIGVPQAQEGSEWSPIPSCGFAAPIDKQSGPPALW